MHILQICKKFPFPLKDGEQIAINTLTREFSHQGCEITVLAINTPKHYYNPLELPTKQRQLATYHAVTVDTKINPVKAFTNLFTKKSFNIQRFYNIKFEEKLVELLTSGTYDIIQLEGIYLATYLPAIRKHTKAKVVLRAHNAEHKIWEQLANLSTGAKKWYLNLLAKRLKDFEVANLNLFDAIVPISEPDEIEFRKAGCHLPSLVIPVGLDIRDYNDTHAQDEFPSLFHIGSMDWMPNVEAIDWFLRNCWDSVQLKFPTLKLYLAGRNFTDTHDWDNYKNVEIAGEVADAQGFVSAKSIMVVPLRQGSGMRVKIIEALAMGKAIISTSIGAQGINAVDGKDMLIADTPEAFVAAIEKLVNNKNEYDTICRHARKFAEQHFDTTHLTKQLLQFYSIL